MILYRPGFEETPSKIEDLIDKTDKLYLLYVKSSIISLCPDRRDSIDLEQQLSLNSSFIEDIEEFKEIPQRSKKKKHSLLKRTTSEPRLNNLEIQSKEVVDNDIKYSNKQLDELDNPYNELYFYIFENVLCEYIESFI
jgi:hypothetical protein